MQKELTRNGKPATVLISADDLDSLEETLTVMSDRSVAAQLRDSQKAVAAGEPGVSLKELRASLEQRRKRGGAHSAFGCSSVRSWRTRDFGPGRGR